MFGRSNAAGLEESVFFHFAMAHFELVLFAQVCISFRLSVFSDWLGVFLSLSLSFQKKTSHRMI